LNYQHLFIIDPLESLNLPLDSSLRMMFELHALGHRIYICEPRHLMWSSVAGPQAHGQAIVFGQNATQFRVGDREFLPYQTFAAIHMRKDPPYDIDYVATTWLLDPATNGTKVYNHPEALRRYNEKLAILRFPQDIRPVLVSSEPQALFDFVVTHCHGDAVLKPLTLFGGRGVVRLTLQGSAAIDQGGLSKEALLAELSRETEGGRHIRLVQPFDPAIFQGEVRVFTAFGEPISWCLKRPAQGQFLANTRAGAQLEPYVPSGEEDARVRRIARELLKEGVTFIGFDLIGGYVSEINLTSPRLLQAPGSTDNYYKILASMIARDVSA
jgi:glutathione synthase